MARNVFLLKFRNKSKAELQYIVENFTDYTKEAVEAARSLLNEYETLEHSNENPGPETIPETTTKKVLRKKPKKKYKESKQSFHYLKNYKWSDFWTTVSLAIFWLGIDALIDYYRYEPVFEEVNVLLAFLPMWLFIPFIGHIFYRFDHGYSNNFLGRTMASYILILIHIYLSAGYYYLVKEDYTGPLDSTDLLVMSFVFIGVCAAYEGGVWMVRQLLRAVRWDVL